MVSWNIHFTITSLFLLWFIGFLTILSLYYACNPTIVKNQSTNLNEEKNPLLPK